MRRALQQSHEDRSRPHKRTLCSQKRRRNYLFHDAVGVPVSTLDELQRNTPHDGKGE